MKYLQQHSAYSAHYFSAVSAGSLLVGLLLPGAGLLVASGCSSLASDGVVTETGNPPVINRDRLQVEVKDGVVTVSGDAGSVSQNTKIRLTNKSTGKSVDGASGSSGSFELKVDGDANDELELELITSSNTHTLNLTATPESNAHEKSGLGDAGSEPSECKELLNQAEEQMAEAIAAVPTRCGADIDCEAFPLVHPCKFSCESVGVQAGQSEGLMLVYTGIDREICRARDELQCQPSPTGTCTQLFPACVRGSCTTADTPPETLSQACKNTRELIADFGAKLALEDRGCTTDANCVLVSGSLTCASSCLEMPLSQEGAARTEALRAELETTVCVDSEVQSCPLSQIECRPGVDFSLGVACIEGLCAPRTEAEAPAGMMNDDRSNISCGSPSLGNTCLSTEYCAYVEGQYCGAADAAATCLPRPEACDGNVDPVCGCDGKTHSNSCVAAEAGTGVNYAGDCDE